MRIDWPLFRLGWQRRSRQLMDNAGSPLWLTRMRCPTARGWGRLVHMLDRSRRRPTP